MYVFHIQIINVHRHRHLGEHDIELTTEKKKKFTLKKKNQTNLNIFKNEKRKKTNIYRGRE